MSHPPDIDCSFQIEFVLFESRGRIGNSILARTQLSSITCIFWPSLAHTSLYAVKNKKRYHMDIQSNAWIAMDSRFNSSVISWYLI